MPSINTFNTPNSKASWVTMDGLDLLLNSWQFGPYFNTDFKDNFGKEFAPGQTITVPKPQQYIVRTNLTYVAQALSRPSTSITLDQVRGVDYEWDSVEKALDMERGEERVREIYNKPAISFIRQSMEVYLAQFAAQNASMVSGALGTNPSTFDTTSGAARQALSQMGAPVDNVDLGMFLPASVIRAVKNSSVAYMNPQTDISKQFRTGMIGVADGFDFMSSNSLYIHTAGTWAGAVTVSGAGQSGSSITLAATTGDTFKKGDKVSFANVNEINLTSRTATTATTAAGTKTFTVQADVTAAAGAATISIQPPITGPGSQYQNVDALPANGAALTLWPGTSSPSGKVGKLGVGMYRDAFLLAMVKLELPKSVEVAAQNQDPDTQLSIRFVRQWDNYRSVMTNRLDSGVFGCGIGLAEQAAIVIAGS